MPYKIRKVPNKQCYQVKSLETGKIHSICTSRKKAEAQVRILEGLASGEGIIDEAKKIGLQVYNKILPQREAGKLRPKSRKLMEQIAQEPITSLDVIRTPIENYISNILQVVSLGKWQNAVRSQGYDKLFHLSLLINKKYVWHKIEVLTLDYAPSDLVKSNSEVQNVPLGGKTITIGDLVQKTREYMGPDKFTSYDPVNNNCQNLVLSTLVALGLNTPQLEKFVKQDSVKIFEQNPSWVGKFAQGVTDVASRVNRLVEGEGIIEDIGSLLGFGKHLVKKKSK